MPELRKCPITGRWVIISTERARRPLNLRLQTEEYAPGINPFQPGNEYLTPPEILAYRPGGAANSPNWSLRVIPNKYPALRVEGTLDKEGAGPYDKMNGVGAHEVIIETPDPNLRFSQYNEQTLQQVFRAYRDRIVDLKRDVRLKYILIFKNEGSSAGATQSHSHSQLIALPIVPKAVAEELRGAKTYSEYKERCIYCDIIKYELKDGSRLIAENPEMAAVAPYASRYPFETWILPRRHESYFETTNNEQFVFLSKIFSETMRRLEKALPRLSYNIVLHTSPLNEGEFPHYHWHFEITTRITQVAGFERGSGFYINPTPPEQAAGYLRKIRL